MSFRIKSQGIQTFKFYFFSFLFRKNLSQLTTPQSQSGCITNAYIHLEISILGEITRQIQLQFNYSKEDFLDLLKSRISSDVYQLLENDIHGYVLNTKGVLVELPDITNLPNETSIFLYNDSFCDEELLEMLKKVKCKGLSPVFAYAGVRRVEALTYKIDDESFREKLEKLVGMDVMEIIWSLEKALKKNK